MKSKLFNRSVVLLTVLGVILSTVLLFSSCDKNETAVTPPPDENEIVTGPKGIVAHKDALAIRDELLRAAVNTSKVTEGVYIIEGLGISNGVVIEGKNGIIVCDTGDHVKEGRERLEEIRKVTQKPVSAVIYSHWHYTNGTSVFVPDGKQVPIIGHKKLDYNRSNAVGLLAPTALRRAAFQFGMYLPKEGPDASPFGTIDLIAEDGGYIKPTITVSNGDELEIDGVRMKFFTDYRSDTDCSLIVHFPELDMVYNNHSLPIFPNLYSLRGQSFRHPKTWIEGIDAIIQLDPEYLVTTHGPVTSGKDAVQARLVNYRDCMQYLYDQTVRGMNKGLTPDELTEFVELPDHLKKDPFLKQIYVGEEAVVRQIYTGLLGWFDGDGVNIERISPVLESQKIIEGFGGREVVLSKARQAFEEKEYNWAAKLATHLINTHAEDKAAKQLKADALRRLGQLSVASNDRNWYITQARILEGKIDLAKPPGNFLTRNKIMEVPEFFVRALRVRVDPEKSRDVEKTLGFNFPDSGKKVSLHVRRGVAVFKESYPEKGVDIEVTMTSETWAKIILKETGFLKALVTGKVKVTKSGITDLKQFMGMFDKG